MLKIQQEITEWKDVEYHQPNHVYLVDGDKVYAYSKHGEAQPQYMKTPLRIDRRGRKFVDVKNNPWGFDLTITVETKPKSQAQTWEVQGSKGNTYTVTQEGGHWTCTCPGATFRGQCRHITEIKPK